MITSAALVLIISSFCSFKNPSISDDAKMSCAESITNCAVKPDNTITAKGVDECKAKYLKSHNKASK